MRLNLALLRRYLIGREIPIKRKQVCRFKQKGAWLSYEAKGGAPFSSSLVRALSSVE